MKTRCFYLLNRIGDHWLIAIQSLGVRALSPVSPVMPVLGLILLASTVAGCTNAPTWPMAMECRRPEAKVWGDCVESPNDRSARDFRAFLETAALESSGGFSDTAGLRRFSPAAPRPPYRLGPLDELSIAVWGTREVWSEVTDQTLEPSRIISIQEDGTITLPLLASTHIANLTLNEALAKIADQYRKIGGGSSFQVSGQILRFRSKPVQLDGTFNKPGTVYLSNEIRTLGEAISIGGGGFPEIAELSKGVLVRGQQRYRINFSGAQKGESDLHNIELEPGDRVYFPSRETGFFHVMGEVMLPGSFPIPPRGITLIEGIGQAKGPNVVTANMASIFLVRVNGEEPRIYRVSLAEIMAARDVSIAPGDRIFVTANGLTNWDRTVRQFFSWIGPAAILHGAFGVDLP